MYELENLNKVENYNYGQEKPKDWCKHKFRRELNNIYDMKNIHDTKDIYDRKNIHDNDVNNIWEWN